MNVDHVPKPSVFHVLGYVECRVCIHSLLGHFKSHNDMHETVLVGNKTETTRKPGQ